MRYAPTGYIKKGPSHRPAPAPAGAFVGRMRYAPTRVHRKREIRKRKGQDTRGEILHVFGIFLLPVG